MFIFYAYIFVYTQENTENSLNNKSINEVKKALNTLNSDMNKFSDEFLDGKNVFGDLEKGQKDAINYLEQKQIKTREKEKSEVITEELKTIKKENMDEIVEEIEIPDLDKKSVSITSGDNDDNKSNLKNETSSSHHKELTLNYTKRIKSKNFLNKKDKQKFVKKISIPSNVIANKFKYKVLENKIIITFPKKK